MGRSEPSGKRGKRAALLAFLKTVPGMLTAIATMLTAIAGILAGLQQLGIVQVQVRSPIVVGPTTTQAAAAPAPATSAGFPAATEPAGTVTPGNGVVTTYVADLQPTQSSHLAAPGEAEINGRRYLHNVLFSACCAPGFADYDLGRHYRRLEATLGVTDEAPADASSTFEVFLDGRKVYTATVGLGRPVTLNLDVSQVLRLHLVVTSTQESFLAALGEAKVLGLRGEVPDTTAG